MSRGSQSCSALLAALGLVFNVTTSLMSRLSAQDSSSALFTSVLNGVFTRAQALRGQQQFQKTCMSCHSVAEHAGRTFGTKWEGSTIGDLFELVSNTMPKEEPGSLMPAEYISILAFFLRESGYKDGDKDLPSDLESLKKIRIEPLPQ